ncbi:MAG: type II secretion system protein [Synechococcaceae cyanobacterium]|nr:type II secretion system protein [Synechococcaceae cyanobacterium]
MSLRLADRLLRRRRRHQEAFTLLEALIAVAMFSIIALMMLRVGDDPREDVSATAAELAGWLDNVQRRSQLVAGQGCTVTFSHVNETPLAAASVLARATPASCAQADAVIPASLNASARFLQRMVEGGPTIVFTPRGTVTATSNTVLRLRRADASPMRCVRVSAILGIVSIGSATSASPAGTTTCSEASYTTEFP